MIRGACTDCGKTYKVPAADRTYKCKACGGTVRVPQEKEPEPEEPKAAIPCPECGAWNDAEDAFCVECGASLKRKSAEKAGATKKRSYAKRKERAVASKELAKAKKGIFIARVIFGFFSFSMVLLGLAGLFGAGEIAGVEGDDAVTFLRVIGGMGLLIGLGFLGIIIFLPRAPMLLGVIGASTYTVFQLAAIVLVGEYGRGTFKALASIVFIWSAVMPLSRVRRILRDHPDLYSARAWGGQDGRLRADGIGTSRAKVERTRSKRGAEDLKLRLAIIGSIVFVLGGGGLFYWLSKQPSELEPRLKSFQQAWSNSNTAVIQPYFATLQRNDLDKWMRIRERKGDWLQEKWPALMEFELGERRGDQALVDFLLEEDMLEFGAYLQTRWKWREDAWYLDKIKLIR